MGEIDMRLSKAWFGSWVVVMGVVTASAAQAKTLYVNGATGNDAVTYAANDEANPWRSIGRASWGSTNREARDGTQAARAGDVVLIAAGVYSVVGTNTRSEISYYTENHGAPGSPVVFRAQGTVNLTLSSGTGPLIGC
ncbi:MAG: hypothetical protein ACKVPX_14165, partial [Myxococcaceae bacterium]